MRRCVADVVFVVEETLLVTGPKSCPLDRSVTASARIGSLASPLARDSLGGKSKFDFLSPATIGVRFDGVAVRDIVDADI